MAEVIRFDPDDLTIGDMIDFQNITGKTWGKAFKDLDGDDVPGELLQAVVYIAKRKVNPDFTLDDARTLKITSLDLTSKADPTPAVNSKPKRKS